MEKVNVKIEQMDVLINKLKALAHPVRFQITDLLKINGEMSAGEIVESTGVEQSMISHQLHILHKQGIIILRRQGRNVIYSVNIKLISELETCFNILSE